MKLNKNKGITLIALVVTIIVLLILAGVTISLALNSNGVFQRSKNAAAVYQKASEDEEEELDRTSAIIDELIGENQEEEDDVDSSIFKYEVIDEEEKTGKITGINNEYLEIATETRMKKLNKYALLGEIKLGASAPSDDAVDIPISEFKKLTESQDYLIIPNKINGLTIIEIGGFEGISNLKKVKIPDTVKVIDDHAFLNCYSLKEVYIGDGVSVIGELAFANTELTETFIPASVMNVGEKAFYLRDYAKIYCEATYQPEGWADMWYNSEIVDAGWNCQR